ncbi:MAG: transglutaminase-like domain-containing protein [Clostridiaceae bacterium]
MHKEYPKKLRIIDGGPWYLNKAPFGTEYEDPFHPLSIKLREKYRLDSVVAGAKTEFEKFLMLKEWVKRQMRQHGWSFNCLKEKPVNALEILAQVENGILFHCLYHAKVFIQCCEALGYPARLVGARMTNHEFPVEHRNNVGHEIAEVWSNEYIKWIMMDCDTNSYYEKDGIPLSISEICVESHKDGGNHVKMIFGDYRPPMMTETGDGGRIPGTDMTPADAKKMEEIFMRNRVIDYYAIVIANSRHDVFSNRDAKPEILSFAPKSVTPMLVYNGEEYFESDLWTDDIRTFNWSVNEVAVRLKLLEQKISSPTLAVALENSMPNFDHYEIRKNRDSDWKCCAGIVRWELEEGVNKIMARAVNTMNIAGPSAGATVLFEP